MNKNTPLVRNYNNYGLDVNGIFKSELLSDEEYAVQSFNIAGLSIGSEIIQGMYGPLTLKGYKLDTSNTSITIKLLVDEKLKVWLSLYNKIQKYLQNLEEGNSELEATSSIHITDNHHNLLFSINMINSKISSLGPLMYELGMPNNQPLHVDLALIFDRLEIN